MIAAVGAASHADLLDFSSGHIFERDHRIRGMGHGHQGLERGQVDHHQLIIGRILIRQHLAPELAAALGLQEIPGPLIAGENAGGGSQFGAHVGDRGPLGHVEAFHPGAVVSENFAHAALDCQPPEKLQDHILGAGPAGQPALQPDPHHIRAFEVERSAGHGHRNVQTARADRDHSRAAAGRCMAVRAQQDLSRRAETLQVHLVADSIARTAEKGPDLKGHALQVAVVIGVLEAGLKHVVVHVADRDLGLDPRYGHRLELQVGHGSGGILGQGLIHRHGDFLARRQFSLDQVLVEYFLNDVLSHFHWLHTGCDIPQGKNP